MFVFKGSPLTAADLGSSLNFAELASWAKFKQEPKSAVVKGDPLKTNTFSSYVCSRLHFCCQFAVWRKFRGNTIQRSKKSPSKNALVCFDWQIRESTPRTAARAWQITSPTFYTLICYYSRITSKHWNKKEFKLDKSGKWF